MSFCYSFIQGLLFIWQKSNSEINENQCTERMSLPDSRGCSWYSLVSTPCCFYALVHVTVRPNLKCVVIAEKLSVWVHLFQNINVLLRGRLILFQRLNRNKALRCGSRASKWSYSENTYFSERHIWGCLQSQCQQNDISLWSLTSTPPFSKQGFSHLLNRRLKKRSQVLSESPIPFLQTCWVQFKRKRVGRLWKSQDSSSLHLQNEMSSFLIAVLSSQRLPQCNIGKTRQKQNLKAF